MDRKLLLLVLVFFLVLGSFTSYVFYRTSLRQIQAENATTPCQSTSFLLAFPNELPVGVRATLNAVVRSCDETTIPGAQVCLTTSLGTIEPECAQTNESGISDHVITSDVQGLAEIRGRVNNSMDIPTPISVQFAQ
ncbi:hypothetical protein A3H80_03590 [Candidatus Roizmanbacteria bacterium RIFCSPLOWO2_02_FULL_37_19]|uniref:Big-1 domain-containing protein n=1 Tax=Candidatus Roizmanbacteria bacterium RIFCSPHIGHO2_02_FULL_37_24 TaxID=1802037 RepID=A0A1F7GVU8_9BACT|nr:MAG: hypothetical protein A2862_04640 [Candidatus Roizmanbacteria bacterium RIFCSPHIGHO2_01_FULL_38_41]OGK22945.1 MAG: hypothetical protein A3C24_03750 [Candidatus Roizmanbacteria bacterium RIFCSPHIGHO2_02_FULL_37_24]OGK33601.1 MAG: hypothetical protein A3E10_05035 [Candidatus Roizmanbacteria bacterium RIFCSPHIGHO2_12_FULL_37_23]OGK44194.1 MAG: hypothetical protein A2956_00845 [Candidatus Roizmanbacteria bacterium RIFCSPLOWO2_01_FULL_37_57]OGK55253.1 MAG: hypothetical protein A3H80_03590 [Ca